MMDKIINRILLNLKLSYESVIIILAEIVKVLSYWISISGDTKKIYKRSKKWIASFKKKLWK